MFLNSMVRPFEPMVMRRSALTLVSVLSSTLALGLVAWPWPAAAQDAMSALSGPAPATPYLAADGSFALRVPQSWMVKDDKAHRDRVHLRSLMAPDAFVEMRKLNVSPGARPKQLALIAKETRLSKMPHFKEQVLREMPINGVPAASIMGLYWYQGNAEYPRVVEEIFLVGQNEGYVFHFECFEPMAPMLAPEVNAIYTSFVPHPQAAATSGSAPAQDEGDIWDKLPF